MTQTSDGGRSEGPTVFLSYAHDNEDHVATVRELAGFLESRGIAVHLDAWYADRRRDWYAWMLREIRAADFVIVVGSPKYRAVGDGTASGDVHRGVQAEAAAVRSLLYRDRETWLPKVLPVVLPGWTPEDLPDFTQAYSASHFIIKSITDDGAEELLRVLTGQPRHLRPPRGKIPILPGERTTVPPAPEHDHGGKSWRVVYLLVPLMLIAAVLALHGDSPPESDGDASPARQGVVEVLAVSHSFTAEVDRIAATVRNTYPESVVVKEIAVYMDSLGNGNPWSDPDEWHFTVPGNMYAGRFAYDGARRTHGLIEMNGTEFGYPLAGQGYATVSGKWRRLLTFAPQQLLAGATTTSITIDLPLRHPLQWTGAARPAGPMTEVVVNPETAAIFTRVDLTTSDDRSFGCHYLRREEDKPVCDSVDPRAEVALPK